MGARGSRCRTKGYACTFRHQTWCRSVWIRIHLSQHGGMPCAATATTVGPPAIVCDIRKYRVLVGQTCGRYHRRLSRAACPPRGDDAVAVTASAHSTDDARQLRQCTREDGLVAITRPSALMSRMSIPQRHRLGQRPLAVARDSERIFATGERFKATSAAVVTIRADARRSRRMHR